MGVGESRFLLTITVLFLLVSAAADSRAYSAARKRRVTRMIPADLYRPSAPTERPPLCGSSSLLSQDQYPSLRETIALSIWGTLLCSILFGSYYSRRSPARSRTRSRSILLVILVAIITVGVWSVMMAARYPSASDLDPTGWEVSLVLVVGLLPLSLVAMYSSAWFTSRLMRIEHARDG
jgi:hypothetical protein